MADEEFQKNVLGEELEACSVDPVTGWLRDGCCNTNETDLGVHTVCARVTTKFLEWAKIAGNDLITPHPEFDFNYNIIEWLKNKNELQMDHFLLSEPIKISFQLDDEQFKSVQKTLEMYGETIVGKSKALRMISSTNLWRRPVIKKSMKSTVRKSIGSTDIVWYDHD